ncbi:putative vitamin h transporter protein [Eutypa lata UCREL1]|uniref:Putative vitamin h transporter protein n=1 Tax=Eutypa lata (strain UCR-EL1) TaxID=1287681 RepID=M7TBF9_EUTLA|nr:putative vitamin h transporter protein [Eutypa lata UCREL1]
MPELHQVESLAENGSIAIKESDLEKSAAPGADYSGAIKKTDPKEIALVKKLDFRIMPILWAMYFMNYLDRNAIANARLNNLEDDLGLVGTQYNTCISILFVGTRKEIAARLSILYSGNIFATAFAGLIAAATFESIDGAHGIRGWQWLFIIEGVVTFCVAIVGMTMLPDSPLTTRWLTPEERQLAHDRMMRDTVDSEDSKGTRAGFLQAIKDPRLYLLAFMQNMHLSACSFNNFFPTVVGSLGFDSTITLALTCPPYLVSGVFGFLAGKSSGHFNERTWHITGGMSMALVGYLISCLTMNTAARYIACFLFASGAYSVNSMVLGWVSATLGQSQEKKAVSLSIVNVAANASYIYTAYLYPKTDGPRYLIGMSANCAFAFCTIAAAWALRFWLVAMNRHAVRQGGLQYAY